MDIRWLARLTLKIELIIEVLPIWYSKVRQMSEILQESDLCPIIHKVGFFRPGHDPKSNCALCLRMFKRWLFYVMNHDSLTDLVGHVFDLDGRNEIRCNLEKWISWMKKFISKLVNNGWAYKTRCNDPGMNKLSIVFFIERIIFFEFLSYKIGCFDASFPKKYNHRPHALLRITGSQNSTAV